MIPIRPLLNYRSISLGSTYMVVSKHGVDIYDNGHLWMGLSNSNYFQLNEMLYELNLAHGICVTTGLGLGGLQTNLCVNPKVSKVIVYERSINVIEIFKKICYENNFDINKIEFINTDADNLTDISCDCMFLDHFESEKSEIVRDKVRKISANNNPNVLWYWPGIQHFIVFCLDNMLPLDNESYTLWKQDIEIDHLPKLLSIECLNIFNLIQRLYITDFGHKRLGKEIIDKMSKNNLIKMTSKFK